MADVLHSQLWLERSALEPWTGLNFTARPGPAHWPIFFSRPGPYVFLKLLTQPGPFQRTKHLKLFVNSSITWSS